MREIFFLKRKIVEKVTDAMVGVVPEIDRLGMITMWIHRNF